MGSPFTLPIWHRTSSSCSCSIYLMFIGSELTARSRRINTSAERRQRAPATQWANKLREANSLRAPPLKPYYFRFTVPLYSTLYYLRSDSLWWQSTFKNLITVRRFPWIPGNKLYECTSASETWLVISCKY